MSLQKIASLVDVCQMRKESADMDLFEGADVTAFKCCY